MNKIFIVVNEDRFFLSHRKDIAIAAKKEGFDVTIVCKDTGRRAEIEAIGLPMIELPINPTGMNLWQEIKTCQFLYRLYRKHRPDIVHHVGLKNILWGGLAAKFAKVPAVVNAVSGLGVLFNGDKASLIARMILRVMSFSNTGMQVAEIFQNNEDRDLFLQYKVSKEKDCYFIKGSGVDLQEYFYSPEPDTPKIRVLFTARMVREKGVLTLIQAANRLKEEFKGKAEFILCGLLSNNPSGIREEELRSYCDGDYIQWLGYRSDIPELLRSSHIMAFPSYYREGVPRSLIEACSTGRPIITCDSIGCKDTVDDGVNGFLISPEDVDALTQKLRILFTDVELRKKMGLESRKKAENEFSIESVVEKHMRIYAKFME